MLKKLYKYDWKAVSLLLCILHVVLLVYTLIGRIGIGVFMSNDTLTTLDAASQQFWGLAGALYILVYVLFIFGIVIATYVYLAIRIQKSMFSDEGYLTHTLPITPAKLLSSKMLIFWTWAVIDMVCVAASLFMLMTFKETLTDITSGFAAFFKALGGFYGGDEQLLLILSILTVLAECFGYFTMLLLFSICLGSLFKSHKILGAVISFFGINMASTILQTIIIFVVPALSPFHVTTVSKAAENGIVTSSALDYGTASMVFSLVWALVFTAVFFLGSKYILSKKLNLE